MTHHFSPLRSLLFLGVCACLSIQLGRSAQQGSAQTQGKIPAPIVHFTDIAAKVGLTTPVVFGGETTKKYIIETTGTGVASIDYDNDGWPDIFIVNGTKLEGYAAGKGPTSHLYHNNHDGTFTDVTEKAGLTHTGWGQGVCVGDYDNDGFEDLDVTYYGKNVLYHNNGNGTFSDVSEKAGVAENKAWSTGCAFVDYDRDGKLDLMVANYVDYDSATAFAPGEKASCMWKGVPVMCGPRGLPWSKNILYRNLGNGAFEDVTKKAKIDQTNGHYAFSVSTLDYDDDGWPDIFVACDSTASILYHNNHDGTFTDVAVISGAAFNDDGREQAGMGSTVGDYDGDGRPDIFKTNFSDDTSTLLHNNGDGTFDDKTFPAGFGLNTQFLGWGTMFLDVDNDGWLDILQVNGHVYPEVDSQHLGSSFLEPKILYHNNGNGTFTDISASSGPAITATSSARGLAVGDLWNDGRMSAVISNMSAAPMLLVNDMRNANHWIAFRTIGAVQKEVKDVKEIKELKDRSTNDAPTTSFASNRDGIGAKITVKAGNRLLVDEVRSGSSYDSNNDMRVHFGLGAATKIDWVQVRWPSGLVERFENLAVDRFHTLREGSSTPVNPVSPKQ